MEKNSLDLLRLIAALMVLYSHQYALLGLSEPLFLATTSFGTAGVSIFFFLSGCLVWTSWNRDPHVTRFVQRRALRILPALLVVCAASVLVLGPWLTRLTLAEYFSSPQTWRYGWTLGMSTSKTLPGVFQGNPLTFAVNGSLWTLPVEMLCYATVASVGVLAAVFQASRGLVTGLCLWGTVLMASIGARALGTHFQIHLDMVAMFWWGVIYGHYRSAALIRRDWVLIGAALAGFALLVPQGLERTGMLMCAGALVHLAMRVSVGARLTGPAGDLSYGVYILAFPVQQWVVQESRTHGWTVGVCLLISTGVTLLLAYFSWHLIEKNALRFKPAGRPS